MTLYKFNGGALPLLKNSMDKSFHK